MYSILRIYIGQIIKSRIEYHGELVSIETDPHEAPLRGPAQPSTRLLAVHENLQRHYIEISHGLRHVFKAPHCHYHFSV